MQGGDVQVRFRPRQSAQELQGIFVVGTGLGQPGRHERHAVGRGGSSPGVVQVQPLDELRDFFQGCTPGRFAEVRAGVGCLHPRILQANPG
jgi:hypothetical protein